MAQGIARFRRSQSRWIANQKQQYRSVTFTPSTWRVLFAAFEAAFPDGGANGQSITLRHYKSHFHYLERKTVKGVSRAEAHLLKHEQRVQEHEALTRRDREPMIKLEPMPDTETKPMPSPPRPKLLRTKATAAAMAEAEAKRSEKNYMAKSGERRTAKRKWSPSMDNDATACKAEDNHASDRAASTKQLKRDRDRLADELKECQASLKRVKRSAHAWRIKYEELLAGLPKDPLASTVSTSSDHNFTFTMNINVDVAQNGEHVRTDRHAVRVSAPCRKATRNL